MLSVEDRPLLLLALLAAGAFLTFVLPAGRRGTRLAIAVVTFLGSLGVVANLATVALNGSFTSVFEEAVTGVSLGLRVDGPGLALAAVSMVAGLFALAHAEFAQSRETAVLVTALGATVAALAGNAVVLFAGAEVAAVGALLLHRAGRGRVSRSVLTAFAVQHALGLPLLAAAVDLIVASGTSDPYSLPASALGVAVAVPWGLAGAAWILAGGWWPGSSSAVRSTCTWLAVGAVPCGSAILLRLGAGLNGAEPPALTATLSAVGLTTALGGGASAWRGRADAGRAGQALIAATAGLDLTLAGVPGGSGAFAAGIVALELALLASPAWCAGVGARLRDRLGAAAALATTGWLPVGFGATVLVLDLGSVAALGPAWAPLLVALGAAIAVVATAALAAAHRALSGPAPGGDGAARISASAVLALLGGGVAGVLPGGMVALAVAPLAGDSAPRSIDLASVSGPGGAWPGGYLSIAILVIGVVVGCLLLVAGRPIPAPAAEPRATRTRPLWLPLIAPRRAAVPALRRFASGLTALDSWLTTQPGLIFVVAAAAVAILVFR